MTDTEYDDLLDFEESDFDTILSSDIDFTGTIKFDAPLMIKGRVKGQIDAVSDLTVEEQAVVHADIKARRVLIKGTVTGNIQSEKAVHVLSCGSLTGNVEAPNIILEKGCYFNGLCTMTRSQTEQTAPEQRQ